MRSAPKEEHSTNQSLNDTKEYFMAQLVFTPQTNEP